MGVNYPHPAQLSPHFHPPLAPRRARIDLAARAQTVDGFGTNVTSAQWRGGALRPVLDQLIDELGCQIFRVDAYGRGDWLDAGRQRADGTWPEEYLAQVYQSPVFADVWATTRYLQSRGAEVIFNISGNVPDAWKDATQTMVNFRAYAEQQASLLRWAIDREGLQLRRHMPFNELDLKGNIEGPSLTTHEQRAALWTAVRTVFHARGLGHLRHFLFCDAGFNSERVANVLALQDLSPEVAGYSAHTYGNGLEGDMSSDWLQESSPVQRGQQLVAASDRPDLRLWLTEIGDLDQSGEIEWEIAWRMVRRLMIALGHGLHAALTWDAFDNYHLHDLTWATYGLIHVDPATWTYTPKRRAYAMRHFFKFIRAGWTRVAVTGCDQSPSDVFRLWHDPVRNLRMQAYVSPDGADATVVVMSLVEGDFELELELPPGLAGRRWQGWRSDRRQDFQSLGVVVGQGRLKVTVAERSIMTVSTLRD
jgi:hypothetical protein